MSKKFLIIAGASLIFIVILIIIISALNKKEEAPSPMEENNVPEFPTSEESTTTETKTDSKTGATLRKLSEHEVFDFWGAPETNDMHYVRGDGKVFAAKSGPDLAISEETLTALNRVEASPSSTKVLAAFGSPETPQWAIFRMSDRSWSPLPGNIIEATWGKDENELIALSNQGGFTNLLRLDITKSPPVEKTILRNLVLIDVSLAYSPLEKVYLVEKPSYLYEGRVFQLDLKNNLIHLLFAGRKGVILRFAENKNFAFNYSSQDNTIILRRDLSPLLAEESEASISLETFPSKCDALNQIIFCFVPILLDNTNLPDNYLTKKFFSEDKLIRIDAGNGTGATVFPAGSSILENVDVKRLRARENKIYFLNRYDNGLYELQLTGDR